MNLFSYYFMVLTVTLVLLEVTRGSIRRTVVAWLAALSVVVCRISVMPFGATTWGTRLQNDFVPIFIGGAAVGHRRPAVAR